MRGNLSLMKAIDVAVDLGVSVPDAEHYLLECDDVVEGKQFVGVLRDQGVVHLAVKLSGLGGRGVLRECRRKLKEWFGRYPVLMAPVKHGNDKAAAMAVAFGFERYADTATHIWFRQTREHFHGQ